MTCSLWVLARPNVLLPLLLLLLPRLLDEKAVRLKSWRGASYARNMSSCMGALVVGVQG